MRTTTVYEKGEDTHRLMQTEDAGGRHQRYNATFSCMRAGWGVLMPRTHAQNSRPAWWARSILSLYWRQVGCFVHLNICGSPGTLAKTPFQPDFGLRCEELDLGLSVQSTPAWTLSVLLPLGLRSYKDVCGRRGSRCMLPDRRPMMSFLHSSENICLNRSFLNN